MEPFGAAFGVHGRPLGSLRVLGRAFERLGYTGGPWVLSWGSFGLLVRSLVVLGSLRELIGGRWSVLGDHRDAF